MGLVEERVFSKLSKELDLTFDELEHIWRHQWELMSKSIGNNLHSCYRVDVNGLFSLRIDYRSIRGLFERIYAKKLVWDNHVTFSDTFTFNTINYNIGICNAYLEVMRLEELRLRAKLHNRGSNFSEKAINTINKRFYDFETNSRRVEELLTTYEEVKRRYKESISGADENL